MTTRMNAWAPTQTGNGGAPNAVPSAGGAGGNPAAPVVEIYQFNTFFAESAPLASLYSLGADGLTQAEAARIASAVKQEYPSATTVTVENVRNGNRYHVEWWAGVASGLQTAGANSYPNLWLGPQGPDANQFRDHRALLAKVDGAILKNGATDLAYLRERLAMVGVPSYGSLPAATQKQLTEEQYLVIKYGQVLFGVTTANPGLGVIEPSAFFPAPGKLFRPVLGASYFVPSERSPSGAVASDWNMTFLGKELASQAIARSLQRGFPPLTAAQYTALPADVQRAIKNRVDQAAGRAIPAGDVTTILSVYDQQFVKGSNALKPYLQRELTMALSWVVGDAAERLLCPMMLNENKTLRDPNFFRDGDVVTLPSPETVAAVVASGSPPSVAPFLASML